MAPFDPLLTHTMTRWPRIGSGFGSPQIHTPASSLGGVRWTPKRESRFTNEAERAATPTVTAVLLSPVKVGDLVALGSHSVAPSLAPGVHEVIEYRETDNLLDTYKVKRLIARPLLGQMFESVTIWEMVREETERASRIVRGPAPVYTGAASVDMSPGVETFNYNSAITEYDTTVTVLGGWTSFPSTRYEIEWTGPFGLLVLDALGPIYNNKISPLLVTLACKARRPSTED